MFQRLIADFICNLFVTSNFLANGCPWKKVNACILHVPGITFLLHYSNTQLTFPMSMTFLLQCLQWNLLPTANNDFEFIQQSCSCAGKVMSSICVLAGKYVIQCFVFDSELFPFVSLSTNEQTKTFHLHWESNPRPSWHEWRILITDQLYTCDNRHPKKLKKKN